MIFDKTSPRTLSGLTITICIKITVNLSNVMFSYKGSLHVSNHSTAKCNNCFLVHSECFQRSLRPYLKIHQDMNGCLSFEKQ